MGSGGSLRPPFVNLGVTSFLGATGFLGVSTFLGVFVSGTLRWRLFGTPFVSTISAFSPPRSKDFQSKFGSGVASGCLPFFLIEGVMTFLLSFLTLGVSSSDSEASSSEGSAFLRPLRGLDETGVSTLAGTFFLGFIMFKDTSFNLLVKEGLIGFLFFLTSSSSSSELSEALSAGLAAGRPGLRLGVGFEFFLFLLESFSSSEESDSSSELDSFFPFFLGSGFLPLRFGVGNTSAFRPSGSESSFVR